MAARKDRGGGRGQEKMWRNAVHLAVKRLVDGSDVKALTRLAETLVEKGLGGDLAAIVEIGNRLDGRPSQSLDIGPPEVFTGIVRKIIDPGVESTQPSAPAGNGADEAEAIGLNATDGSESVEDVHDTKGKLNG